MSVTKMRCMSALIRENRQNTKLVCKRKHMCCSLVNKMSGNKKWWFGHVMRRDQPEVVKVVM